MKNSKLKIDLFISSLTSGGAERVVSLLANKFVDRGHKVRLITFSQLKDAYILDPRVERINYDKRIYLFNYTSIKCFFFLLGFYFKKKNRPDVICAHMTLMGYPTIPISLIYGIKLIVTEHTNHINSGSFLSSRIVWRLFYPFADAITVLTNFDVPFFKKFNKNTLVITNPCSFEMLKDDQIPGEREKIILSVGSLDRYKEKGFDNLIEIAHKVLPGNPEWKLKIVGDGVHGKKFLQNKVNELNISNQVIFTGFRSDVIDIMRKSEIFILHSRFEGMPMALLEAMTQKMVCISYNCISGPAEIITNNKNGILIKNQDKMEMVEKLNLLLQDKVLRSFLRENINGSLNKFSINEVVNKWEKLFDEINH